MAKTQVALAQESSGVLDALTKGSHFVLDCFVSQEFVTDHGVGVLDSISNASLMEYIQAEDKVDLISAECNETIDALKQHFSAVIQNMVAKLQSLSIQSDFAGFNLFYGFLNFKFL